jgi:dihydropteroate synthase
VLTLQKLSDLYQAHPDAALAPVREFTIGNTLFAFNARPHLMGVVNLSPDSWYRESVCLSTDRAIQRGRVLAAQGADLVDVGAESTLAQAALRGVAEQNSKLIPVIQGLADSGILVSVETYHPEVAQACLDAGAHVLNLTGVAHAERIYALAAERNAGLIICYVQGKDVRQVGDFDFSADPVAAMYEYFARAVDAARRCGVQRILLDPGLGFYYRNLQDSAVRVAHQMRVFLESFRLRTLGYPVCQALPHAFEYFGEEVRAAESFFAVVAALGKTDLFRTHEVARVKAVLDTLTVF